MQGKCLIGSQVMWLFDVTAAYWTKRDEGYEELCWSYYLYDTVKLTNGGGGDNEENRWKCCSRLNEVHAQVLQSVLKPLTQQSKQ